MEIFFPARTLPLVHVFAPCFTACSFAYFQAYVGPLMVVEGRKCWATVLHAPLWP
jgi:hypothetical protein